MTETFGLRLRRFVLAIDNVDVDIFKQVWNLILNYIEREMDLTYWALLIEASVNFKPGLQARECSEGNKPSFSINNEEDNRYNGLAAYSFAEEKPLWIISSDRQPLSPDTPLQDCWSEADCSHHFIKSADANIKTIIHIPIRWKGRTLGLLDLQSKEYYEFSNLIASEMQLLTDTLYQLLHLLDENNSRRENTLEAINMHRIALQEENWPRLTKPQIFVASSNVADPDVMGTIRSVLDEFKDQLRVHYWKDSSESGNINNNILKQVLSSKFGLCYFSEPASDPGGELKYQDNNNVIFEAGMFQSLTNPAIESPTGWIPIREQEPLSPPPPFDFAQHSMVMVERLSNGKPNTDLLKANLQIRIEKLLIS